MASYSGASFVHLGILQKCLISDICRTLLVQQSRTTMADKQEINKNTANNQSCSLSAKFVSTLRDHIMDEKKSKNVIVVLHVVVMTQLWLCVST